MGVRVIAIPHCGLLTPLNVIWFTQFVGEITKVEAREEIWSSVNYPSFLLVIYRKNRQVRRGTVWLRDLKDVLGSGWVELGTPGLKVSYNVLLALLKWQEEKGLLAEALFSVSCKELLTLRPHWALKRTQGPRWGHSPSRHHDSRWWDPAHRTQVLCAQTPLNTLVLRPYTGIVLNCSLYGNFLCSNRELI